MLNHNHNNDNARAPYNNRNQPQHYHHGLVLRTTTTSTTTQASSFASEDEDDGKFAMLIRSDYGQLLSSPNAWTSNETPYYLDELGKRTPNANSDLELIENSNPYAKSGYVIPTLVGNHSCH